MRTVEVLKKGRLAPCGRSDGHKALCCGLMQRSSSAHSPQGAEVAASGLGPRSEDATCGLRVFRPSEPAKPLEQTLPGQ